MVFEKYGKLYGKTMVGKFEISCNLSEAKPQYRDLVVLVGVPGGLDIHRWTGA